MSLSELSPIRGGVVGSFAGSGQLRNDAAACWNAFAAECERHGAHVTVNGPASAYRNLAYQQYFYRLYGPGRAAYPGTSNHGWGIATDNPPYVIALMRSYGAKYGWGPCSDAPWESWHKKWCGGSCNAKPPKPRDRYPTLRKGSDKHAAVRRAQKHLRRWNVGMERPKADGGFGPATFRAVWQFQLVHGLKPDGVIGDQTWARLRLKDHFLNDERAWLNHLRYIHYRRKRSGTKPSAKEYAAMRRLRKLCAKRAHSIKQVAREHGWGDHSYRLPRFKQLRHAAGKRY
jgi:peptidoglycan hydrolase-like protein with peptidoglycan-binding domain